MSLLLDFVFVIVSEVFVNLISGFAEVPLTIFTEFLLGLMGR